jgi:hypothetical protein
MWLAHFFSVVVEFKAVAGIAWCGWIARMLASSQQLM